MPELESLTLCGCDDNDIWPQLVCGQLPRLRKLTLDRALAPWKWAPSQLAPLVSLSILGLQYGRWPSIDDFIFMLGSCTALETLTLHDAAPKLTWWNIGDEPRRLAILPSLRELELRGSIVDITTLITHLAPRMLRLITLNYCHADLGDALHAEEAVKQALRLLSRFSLMEMERLVLRLERHDRGPVAFITGCGHQQTPPCLVIHIDVNEIWPQSTSTVEGEEFESLLLHSLEGIPPLAPRRLDIEYIVPPQRMGVLSSRQWLRVFHCFPGITHLTIAGACAYVLLSELSISPSSSHRPLCPELKHLTFRAPSLDSASARALYRAVASRRVRNESLQTLTLNFRWPRTDHETHSLEQEIQTLRGLVEAENFHCSLQDTLQGL
ncbi:hypothetical protein CERSUDRAFT_100643 [Gelatoporia subvermispora B]|uniref:F-box domain-containing protein n=1 Tax=Ceriporiopsis subvermispora (strain B) TaxID=914234 RepID=M2QXD1_CERS8|nr:hypothetical protein CERSUDRAFT_100643 [Gelatoporia subvermispora B]